MKVAQYLISFSLCMFASVSVYAETARIITKENAVRENCRFFAPVKAKVQYNEAVEIISREGDWLRVRYRGISGCIHKCAIEERRFTFSGFDSRKTQSASGDEVALAGKGFNLQVEQSFSNKHPELNFPMINMIESYRVSEDDVKKFMMNGGLNQPR
jgi:hypothetical protein